LPNVRDKFRIVAVIRCREVKRATRITATESRTLFAIASEASDGE